MISVQLSQDFLERLVEDVLFDWWPDITGTTVHIPGIDDGYARVIEVQPGEWIPVAWCQVWIQPPCAMKPPSSPRKPNSQTAGQIIASRPNPPGRSAAVLVPRITNNLRGGAHAAR
ncbi:hypothetical protein [Saccharopolyspora hattusasensis]|uniref:hypothetical protein n=1 Tax=Saccharopolyspora hattusasensis TaxID=1128679 RepID=UPI003D961726